MLGFGPIGGAPLAALATAVVLSVTPPQGPQAGGTDVVVNGLNFSSAAAVKFGTTSPTSPVVVDATTITCTTAAGDSEYIDDVTVTNVAGVDAYTASYLYDRTRSVAASVNPATRSLTALFLSSYALGTYAGTASAGSSGSDTLTGPGGGAFQAVIGSSLNGIASMGFRGPSASYSMEFSSSTATLLGTTGWSFAGMVKMISRSEDTGVVYSNPLLFGDINGALGITVSKQGLQVFQSTSGGLTLGGPFIPIPPDGTWFYVQARWTGTRLEARVNCGPWYGIAFTSFYPFPGITCRIGGGAYSYIDADITGVVVEATGWTDAQADGIAASMQTTYAKSGLGFPTGTVAVINPATLLLSTYVKDFSGSLPYAGTASAGASGSNPLVALTSAPGLGSLNAHGTLQFAATSAVKETATAPTSMAVALTEPKPGFSSIYLVKFNSLNIDFGVLANDSLWTDSSGAFGLVVSSTMGVQGFLDRLRPGEFYEVTPSSADYGLTTATWMMVQERWNGGRLEIRVLDGAARQWVGTPVPAPVYQSSNFVHIGAGYPGTPNLDADVAAVMRSTKAFSSYTLDGLAAWAQTTYALSLGITAGSTNYTLATTTGAYALSMKAALFGVKMPAAVGSFTWTRNAANLLRGVRMPTAVGSFTWTRNAANLLRGARLVAVLATYAIAGNVAGLLRGLRLLAVLATFTWARSAANLLKGSRLTAVVGPYVLAMNAAILSRARVPLAAAVGAFALAMNAAGFSRGRVPLAAVVGSFALSMKAAGLAAQRRLTATLQTYAIGSSSAGLAAQRRLTATLQTYAIAGVAVVLRAGKGIAAVAGSYAVGSSAAGLTKQSRLTAVVGSYALSLKAATLTLAHQLVVSAGAFTWTRNAATLTKQSKLTCVVGAYAVGSGPTSLLAQRKITATLGTYSVAGIAVTFRAGKSMPAAAGAFAVGSSATSFSRTRKLVATTAAFALAGLDVAFGVKMPAAVGAFAWARNAASLLQGRRLASATGAVAVSGIAVLFRRGLRMPATTGTIVIAGAASSLAAQRKLTATTRSFALAGQATSFAVGRTLAISPASFALVGLDAHLSSVRGMFAGPGAFAVAGYDAELSKGITPFESKFRMEFVRPVIRFKIRVT